MKIAIPIVLGIFCGLVLTGVIVGGAVLLQDMAIKPSSRVITKYVLMPHAQMVFDKNTPWNNFTIQEKMFLCAFGSSGNKLDKQDLKEIVVLYGVE